MRYFSGVLSPNHVTRSRRAWLSVRLTNRGPTTVMRRLAGPRDAANRPIADASLRDEPRNVARTPVHPGVAEPNRGLVER